MLIPSLPHSFQHLQVEQGYSSIGFYVINLDNPWHVWMLIVGLLYFLLVLNSLR